MTVEEQRNRDLLVKICFMYYLIHIVNALGIDEEIEDILPTEGIVFENINQPKIFDNFMDFKVLTKSGKIIIFEFKKNKLTKNDLKQLYKYYRPEFCKDDENTKSIFIVISRGENIAEYHISNMKFCPEIIKTKEISKQKDLNQIRHKFENNELLNSYECALVIAFPIFELGESEDAIVEEMCVNIAEKRCCIPENELDKIVMGMYLNIVEYIDHDKQGELFEMIDMVSKTEGLIASIIREGERNIIDELLKTYSIDEISDMIHKKPTEIRKILDSD